MEGYWPLLQRPRPITEEELRFSVLFEYANVFRWLESICSIEDDAGVYLRELTLAEVASRRLEISMSDVRRAHKEGSLKVNGKSATNLALNEPIAPGMWHEVIDFRFSGSRVSWCSVGIGKQNVHSAYMWISEK